MRLSNTQAVARPVYYDRNTISRIVGFVGNLLSPHTTTQRFSYTVPANRKAFVEHVVAQVQRATVATTGGAATSEIDYQPSGQSSSQAIRTFIITNNIGDWRGLEAGQFGEMGAGDIISGSTTDNSTGGTVYYDLTVKYSEFDA